jgi:hypothetical protein
MTWNTNLHSKKPEPPAHQAIRLNRYIPSNMQQQIAAVSDCFARQCAIYFGIPPPSLRQAFGITPSQLRLIGPIDPGNIDIVAKHHGSSP